MAEFQNAITTFHLIGMFQFMQLHVWWQDILGKSRKSLKVKKILERQENLGKTKKILERQEFFTLQEIIDDTCEAALLEMITGPVRKLFIPINHLLPSCPPFLRSMARGSHYEVIKGN